jgi:hypothetical protein
MNKSIVKEILGKPFKGETTPNLRLVVWKRKLKLENGEIKEVKFFTKRDANDIKIGDEVEI